MNHINQFYAILGSRKTGVKFNSLEASAYNAPSQPMKFCDAVITSLNAQLLLRKKDIDCIGARRSFGFYQNDQNFTSQISEETNISRRFIEHAISQIPVIDIPVKNILLGSMENPDITIAFVKPAIITKLIFLYASIFEEIPIVSPYFFMSVCANIAVKTYLTNKICISFGCPESRKEGRVNENEVIVGIPNSLLNK